MSEGASKEQASRSMVPASRLGRGGAAATVPARLHPGPAGLRVMDTAQGLTRGLGCWPSARNTVRKYLGSEQRALLPTQPVLSCSPADFCVEAMVAIPPPLR